MLERPYGFEIPATRRSVNGGRSREKLGGELIDVTLTSRARHLGRWRELDPKAEEPPHIPTRRSHAIESRNCRHPSASPPGRVDTRVSPTD
jgi:hypothetical protein